MHVLSFNAKITLLVIEDTLFDRKSEFITIQVVIIIHYSSQYLIWIVIVLIEEEDYDAE